MPDTDAVLNQADALMRRHRSFVARAPGADIAQGEAASDADFDLPILTEVIEDHAAPPASLDALLDDLQQEIEQAMSDWLVEALPQAIAGASQHIIAELDAKARHTLLPRLQQLIRAQRDRVADSQSL